MEVLQNLGKRLITVREANRMFFQCTRKRGYCVVPPRRMPKVSEKSVLAVFFG
jgi:hypothetical protein